MVFKRGVWRRVPRLVQNLDQSVLSVWLLLKYLHVKDVLPWLVLEAVSGGDQEVVHILHLVLNTAGGASEGMGEEEEGEEVEEELEEKWKQGRW